MRSLLIAENLPWPALGGNLVRLGQVVEAVASVSDLDLFILHDPRRQDITVPATVHVARSKGAVLPHRCSPFRWRIKWALRRDLPAEVAMASADTGPRAALREWALPPYDVVWFSTARSYHWTGRPHFGPTIVDLDDLEDRKAELRADLLRSAAPGSLRDHLAWYRAKLNAADWHRFQRSVAAQVERVVIASGVDVERCGLPNVTVIPNSFPRPERPAGNPAAGGRQVVLFQGHLGYPPNIDAAEWLVRVILPRIRATEPSTEVRLVGLPGTGVKRLAQTGGVSVVGQVPSMDEELAGATVAVVPIRYGSGTRVKILESFANRVPVVSTTLGAEGLEVEDGVHLLVADDPDDFAAATVRILEDAPLRQRLVEAAEALYLDRYDGHASGAAVRDLLDRVARQSTRS